MNTTEMVNLNEAATSGIGIYSVREAARYAKMHPLTLNDWFFGRSNRPPMRRSGIEANEQKVISFLNFVEAVAVRSLRVDYNVSFPKIREAIENAKRDYNIDHPFAHGDHRTVLIGKDLHIFLGEDQANPVQLTGRYKRQKSLRPCIEGYIQDLEFGEDRLAQLYTAAKYSNQRIVLNPKFYFGAPILLDSGITAETLWRAAVAEGSYTRAAQLYKVTEAQVEAAYRYYNGELGVAA